MCRKQREALVVCIYQFKQSKPRESHSPLHYAREGPLRFKATVCNTTVSGSESYIQREHCSRGLSQVNQQVIYLFIMCRLHPEL